ncbi:MAG: YkgJ family cysteine cluster protein [Desulfocapsaceae bacterium]|nr:YkgJ family cysteine cluster protein [Desulfocapsaceae bacterium]
MKTAILTAIYDHFDHWSSAWRFSCRSGCSTCCTTRVTVTALEGRRILDFCHTNDRMEWLVGKLAIDYSLQPQAQTTNEFVAASLEDLDDMPSSHHSRNPCPFLEKAICTIYEVRPFSCRCFASTSPCNELNTATVDDDYLYGSTAAMQLIEHLGQFDSWGYLQDVLLLEIIRNDKYSFQFADQGKHLLEKLLPRLRRAQPLPGFVLPEAHKKIISSLIEPILSSQIGGYTIQEIFNGKKGSDIIETKSHSQQ